MSTPLDAGNSRPTLLLVHGAFLGAWSWEKVQLDLLGRGWRAQTVELPSVADRGSPRAGLFEDAEIVRQRIKEIDEAAVVVSHSYSGAVVTQAAADLTNVRHLVYISAFPLDIGESLLGVLGRAPDWLEIDGDLITASDPHTVFLADVPQDVADGAVDRLKPTSLSTLTQTLTACAWHTIPSTYVVTERDRAAPLEAQEFLAARATYVRRLPSAHTPMLSMPSALADLIVEAASTDTEVPVTT
jgi:pimeloyl-ACP methyl ester carboxylesterase